MQSLVDSFWRAAAYCLHPRVIGLSLLPLIICGVLVFGFMFFFWEGAIAAVRATLESWRLIESLLQWLDSWGLQAFRSALAAIVVLAGVLPVVIVMSLLLVALLMTPAIVRLVGQRRFPLLEKKRGGTLLQSAAASLGATLLALVLIILSMPLWLIPPLVMVRALLREHRIPMLTMGVVCGYLGAVPSLIWAVAGVTAIIFAPFVVLLAIWLYTLVFAFSTAWFTHYALAALQARRAAEPVAESAVLLEN
jgi:hypothetical protein